LRGHEVKSDDDPDPMLDQIHRQCRQLIVLAFCPTIFDPEAAAGADAGLDQTLLKGSRQRQWRREPFV